MFISFVSLVRIWIRTFLFYMYQVQYVVTWATYLYLLLPTYSMNKSIRPLLSRKATEVNMVDQIQVFIVLTFKPFTFKESVAQGMCLKFGENKNNTENPFGGQFFRNYKRTGDSTSYEEWFFAKQELGRREPSILNSRRHILWLSVLGKHPMNLKKTGDQSM